MMRNLSARVGSLGQVSKTNSDHILPKERSNFFSDNTLKTKLFGNGIRVDLPPQMNVSHHDPNRWGSLSMPSPCSDCHARPPHLLRPLQLEFERVELAAMGAQEGHPMEMPRMIDEGIGRERTTASEFVSQGA